MSYEFGRTIRLTLLLTDPLTGVYADGTGVSVEVTSPTGVLTHPSILHPSTGSYYADETLAEQGDWGFVWSANGAVADESAASVTAPGAVAAWTPTLDQIAAHVPLRTIEVGNLTGSPTGTFTGLTMPTAGQVDLYATDAVSWVSSAVSVLSPALFDRAQGIAGLWAAAQVELAQPVEFRDDRRYATLLEQATTGMTALVSRNEAVTGTGADEVAPAYSYPEPVPWGDRMIW